MADDRLYFGERQGDIRPRTEEEITDTVWSALVEVVNSRIDDGSFAEDFPENCYDAPIPVGTSTARLATSIRGDFPQIQRPLDPLNKPSTVTILELIEFLFERISSVKKGDIHAYWGHRHIVAFDRDAGRDRFRRDINRMLRRNGLAYELDEIGLVRRIGPELLTESLGTELRSGEAEVDRLIGEAIKKFRSPDPTIRLESLEKLWDAWERIKTIEPGANKLEQTQALFRRAILSEQLRAKADEEGRALTGIGNEFQIRHTEVGKTPITQSTDVDYLFHRLYALIRLLIIRRTHA